MTVHLQIIFLIVLFNILPSGSRFKKNVVLPVSFIILFIYWAIRYEYGQDYWNYCHSFYGDMMFNLYGTGDILFYMWFFPLFDYYWQAIVGQSAFIMLTLFVFVRKYIPPKAYWIFFFLFLATGGFHFSLISALRSSMAAGVMYWGFSLCVIDKWRPFLFFLFVIVASLFHTSAVVFLLYPFVRYVIAKMGTKTILISLFVCNLFAMFIGNYFFHKLTSAFSFFEYYDHYSERIANIGWSDFVLKCVYFLPLYYICRYYNFTNDLKFKNAFYLAITFFFINFLNMDFHGRYTAFLFIFYVMVLCHTYQFVPKKNVVYMLGPYFVVVLFWLGMFYYQVFSLRNSVYIGGNFDVYKTIFDAPSFP